MLRRDITYENPFTQQQVTETHFFHISKADLVEMEIEEHGETYVKDGKELTGMQAKLQRIVDAEDGRAIMREFKDIIRRSYGVKDGDNFRKTQENWDNFSSTEAFSQLLFELCTKPDEAAKFVNGVVPHNLDKIAAEVQAEAEKARHAEALGTKGTVPTAEAPATEPATGTTQPADSLPPESEAATADNIEGITRQEEIRRSTPEHPVTLNGDEIATMDSEELRSGVATGRYRLN